MTNDVVVLRTPAIIVDIDGTVALMGKEMPGRRGPFDFHRVGEDDPNTPIIELINLLRGRFRIIFVSGRSEVCRIETQKWLEHHCGSTPDDLLYMREINDFRSDHIIKREIYDEIIPYYEIMYVFDDRNTTVRMWRELGLCTLQVAPGNF